MGARLNINQSNPRDKIDAKVLAKSNIFLTPPPLKHIVCFMDGDQRFEYLFLSLFISFGTEVEGLRMSYEPVLVFVYLHICTGYLCFSKQTPAPGPKKD